MLVLARLGPAVDEPHDPLLDWTCNATTLLEKFVVLV